ncbi:PH0542 domain-containing protein [Thermococcus sp.]
MFGEITSGGVMSEEEFDIRESLATGENLDKIIIKALYDKSVFEEVIRCLDDDLWIVSKNALVVLLEIAKERRGLYKQLLSKLMSLIRKSESVPLTQEIARAFGIIAKEEPSLLRNAIPILFASYRIGNWKIKINMAYVLEEIMRTNPTLLGDIVKDIHDLLSSKDVGDRLAALNFISALGKNSLRYIGPFLPKLLNLLQDPNPVVRAAIVETLVDLAADNPKFRNLVISKLQDLNDPDPLVNRKIKEGISQLLMKQSSLL